MSGTCNAVYESVNLPDSARCDQPSGHTGPHEEHWVDRNGTRRVWLTWDTDTPGTHSEADA